MSWLFIKSGGGTPFSNTKSTLFSSSQNINMGNNLDWTGGSARTFAGWIKTTKVGGGAILAKGVHFGAGYDFFHSVGAVSFYCPGSSGTMYFTAAGTINDGNWHLAVVTSDGTKTVSGCTVYVDGVSQTITPITDTLSGSLTNTRNFLIGDDLDGEQFVGNVEEVSVWDVAFNSSQITALYNGGTPTDLLTHSQAAHLIGWWRMGDSPDTTSTYVDASGAGHDGTPSGIAGGDIVSDVP